MNDPPQLVELGGEFPGPEDVLSLANIERLMDLADGSAEVGLRLSIARRADLPFSEVCDRWTVEDLAWDLAASRMEAADREKRCPSCGVRPDEQLGPGGRHLADNFAMRLDVRHCAFCADRDEVIARETNQRYTKPAPNVRYVPRLNDEPFYEEPRASQGDPG